jgi:hypothetical protein
VGVLLGYEPRGRDTACFAQQWPNLRSLYRQMTKTLSRQDPPNSSLAFAMSEVRVVLRICKPRVDSLPVSTEPDLLANGEVDTPFANIPIKSLRPEQDATRQAAFCESGDDGRDGKRGDRER